MNTFKAILMICATLSVSCSGQYATQQSETQGQQPAAGPSYGNLGELKGSQLSFASPSQGSLNTPAAGTGAGSRPTCAPAAATTQICSCVTVNAGQQSVDNTGSNQATSPVATLITAPSYTVPAASSSSGSQQSYASQSAPLQSGGDNRGPAMAAYPTAAIPTQTSEEY